MQHEPVGTAQGTRGVSEGNPVTKSDQKQWPRPPDDIIVWAVSSFSGEITPNIRMIAFACEDRKAKFVFYTEKEPSENDREHAEIGLLNFDCGIGPKELEVDFVVTSEPLGRLDPLGFTFYRRCEEDL
jgi:hypothetical protein